MLYVQPQKLSKPMLLPVILHPDVTDFLRIKFPKNLKDSTWKCIDKLRQQNFDGGLRVKKLQGVSRRVWEARITKAIRLIFTYEQSINPNTKQPQIYVAVQDICLDHDDVSRCAKARNRTPDAQWLDAEEVKTIGSVEIDHDALSGKEQSALLTAIDEELEISDNITDELLGNIQWQVLDSESDWHKAIVKQDENLPLRLSVEESELVNHYGNLLLSGSAGTGKTTVGLYQLLKSLERLSSGKRLYVAYNPILVKETSQQFARLVGSKITEIESWFQFQTIQDLCSQTLLQAGKIHLEYDEVDYQVFERLYCRHPLSKKYPSVLVWDEIRSIIKGSYLKTDKKLFSLSEYKALGRNQSSVISQQERPKIYEIAQWYQKYLATNKRFDEIDLARSALKYILEKRCESYQMIICDEVQDLTKLQLHLLMQLITPDGHLFFAGDLNQMISPSGFRWEDLKSLFYNSEHLSITNRQVVEKKLHFNFRSVSSLVQLANQLLILRSRLLSKNIGDREPFISQSNQFILLEKPARLINAPLEKIESIVKQLYSGDAVLVRTQEQKEEISQRLDSSLVFTIEEAKGLEFDTVFLVEFFLPYQDLWQKAINGMPALKDKELPQLRLELNLLYVAITRARRILNVWQDRFSVIWNQPELVDLVEEINAQSTREERLESTTQMWQERGIYFLDAKRYRQAVECFKNSGDIKLQWQASAKLALQEEEYTKAAEFFVMLEDWQQAARLYEKTKQWNEAAQQYELAGMKEKADNCRNKIAELLTIEKNKQKNQKVSLKIAEGTNKHLSDIGIQSIGKNGKLQASKALVEGYIPGWKYDFTRKIAHRIGEDQSLIIKLDFNEFNSQKIPDKYLKIKNLQSKAKQSLESNNVLEFRQIIIELRQLFSTNSLADQCIRQGCIYNSKGYFDEAIAQFNRAVWLNPYDALPYYNLGLSYLLIGNYKKGIENFNISIEIDPGDPDAYDQRGRTFGQHGQVENAILDFNRAITIDPNHCNAYLNLGALLSSIQKYQEAIQNYNQCIQINSNDADAYYNRALAFCKLKFYEKALNDYEKSAYAYKLQGKYSDYQNSLNKISEIKNILKH